MAEEGCWTGDGARIAGAGAYIAGAGACIIGTGGGAGGGGGAAASSLPHSPQKRTSSGCPEPQYVQ
jgi:hypothetical protein